MLINIPLTVVGKPKLTEHPIVQEVATKLGATPAQVLIAWCVRRGYSVIPKSVQEGACSVFFFFIQLGNDWFFASLAERILSNFKQIELSQENYNTITAIGHGNYTRSVIIISYRLMQCLVVVFARYRFNIPYNYSPNWDLNVFGEPDEKNATYKVKIQ